jgi:hypothetical protein
VWRTLCAGRLRSFCDLMMLQMLPVLSTSESAGSLSPSRTSVSSPAGSGHNIGQHISTQRHMHTTQLDYVLQAAAPFPSSWGVFIGQLLRLQCIERTGCARVHPV